MGFSNGTTEELMNSTSTEASNIAFYTKDVAERVMDFFVETVFGSPEITGLAAVTFMEYLMIKNEVDATVQIIVVSPIILVLANFGFLPFGDGLVYGLILVLAFIASVAGIKYFET